MRNTTRIGPTEIDETRIIIDPIIAAKPSIDVPGLCDRCAVTVFGPVTWSHLSGETLSSEASHDQDADYHITNVLDRPIKMNCTGPPLPKERGPVVDFQIRAGDVVESCAQSCKFCKMMVMLDDIDEPLLSKTDSMVVLRMQAFWPKKNNGRVCPMVLEIGLHRDMFGGGNTTLLTFIDADDASNQVSGLDTASESDDLLQVLDQINMWLEQCADTHTLCMKIDVTQRPTRVLDLADIREHDRIKLVELSDVTEEAYAMLSYVWGTSTTLRLLQASKSEFMASLDMSVLPRTINAAAHVARALGIRYLWVDALCIIQDSEQDKLREIVRMAEYYRNAFLVISASGSQDVNTGLFRFQETYLEHYNRLKNPTPPLQRKIGPGPFQIPIHYLDHSRIYLVDIFPQTYRYSHEPINRRAWTLQESVLPRRLLSFPSTGGAFMQCLQGEALAGEIMSSPYDEAPEYMTLGILSLEEKADENIPKLWYSLIQDYTRRLLTHQSDILIAVGALARNFHSKHSAVLGNYAAGLWRNRLREGLLWFASAPDGRERVPPDIEQSQYSLTPSWSWASVVGPVNFKNEPEILLALQSKFVKDGSVTPRWYCEIMNYHVMLASELDPFGAVSAGYLKIRGPLRPLSPRKWNNHKTKHDDEKLREDDSSSTTVSLDVMLPGESTTDSNPCLQDALSRDKEPEFFALDSITTLDWSNSHQYYWLAVRYAGRSRARGLILEQVDETDYRRVGFAIYVVSHETYSDADLHKEPIIKII